MHRRRRPPASAGRHTVQPRSADGPVPGNRLSTTDRTRGFAARLAADDESITPEIEPPRIGGQPTQSGHRRSPMMTTLASAVTGSSSRQTPCANAELLEAADRPIRASRPSAIWSDRDRARRSSGRSSWPGRCWKRSTPPITMARTLCKVCHSATTLDGIYVNGELVAEAPDLEDYHSISMARRTRRRTAIPRDRHL